MKHLGYVACAALLVGVVAVGCGKEEGAAPGPAAPPVTVIAQKTCPVEGNPIDKTVFSEYKGRKIYFCCPGCLTEFKKDPEKYVKKVDEEIGKQAPPKKESGTEG